MHIPVGNIFESEFSATSPKVAFLIPITLKIAANSAHHGKASNIEFSILVQKRSFDVLLDYVTSFESIHIGVAYKILDLIKIFRDLDATPPVSVLTWFDDPQLLSEGGYLVQYSFLGIILGFMIKLFKFMKLWIIKAFLDVELQRQNFVVLLIQGLVVYFHVIVNSLLIGQMVVVLHL